MDRDSSDEEGDRRNLIFQNETKQEHLPTTGSTRSPRSTFQIEELESRIRRRGNCNVNKRYIFAISLPLLIIILYFSTDIRNLFSTDLSKLRFDSLSERVKDSQLRALYLLRQQQYSLITLWNNTSLNSPSSSSNSSVSNNDSLSFTSSTLIEDVKSNVLKQISLNKQIQQVLLSPHRTGNVSDSGVGSDEPGYYYDRCRLVDQKLAERKTIEWKPRPNKFLFAICLSGQMSNHLICLEKHMFFAAALGRILVIPSSKVDYTFNRVLDFDHINNCVDKKVVISFEEFMETRKNHARIDKFICYFSSPDPCYVDEDHVKKLKGLGISIQGKLEAPWDENVKKPSKKTIQDVQSNFKSDEDVIAIGDVFFADLEQDWVMQPGGPIAHKCKMLIEPSRLILLTAQRFIQTFLGKNYISLHFRRHGFLKFCNAKKPSCFYPIPQAADCITRLVERANAPVIYLSTDAAESETGLLQSLIMLNGKSVPLVQRPARNSAEKWDALLYRHSLEGDTQVEAMLDKTICAMSSVFIGASGSTFTEDILRLRRGWGTASMCDEYLCQGEEPNFIADDE